MVPKSLYTIFASKKVFLQHICNMPVVSKAPLYKIGIRVSLDVTIVVLYNDPSRPGFVIFFNKAGEQRCLSCLSLTSFRDVAWEDIRDLMVLNAHKKPLSLACFLNAVTQSCKLICSAPAPTPSLFPSPPLPLYAIVEHIIAHVRQIVNGSKAQSLLLSFLHHESNHGITHENISFSLMNFIKNLKRPKSYAVLELYINELCAQLFAYAKTPTDESLRVLVEMLELSDLICAIHQKWCLDYHTVKKAGKYVLKIEISLSILQTQKAFNLLMETNHVEGYLSLRNALQLPTNVSVQFIVKN